ncbi:Colicin-E3 immunity protein [Xenorhabdus mauleonii]|uniref:Colicin-E3 immunity protein n=1 Tax=Xenorhabdus mauleonii TaxID=351675 RepID=A0A1I3SGM2_9GAMM|nr:hypothetical protein [Xenorhabdus mauleonii]PHM39160.1 Colicin-E3 immunity protein [Xenorhabdus mauleonii]SFJ57162.1 hypothetical protein SAMN05421680_11186 [Xenorhabdus mauleonii]
MSKIAYYENGVPYYDNGSAGMDIFDRLNLHSPTSFVPSFHDFGGNGKAGGFVRPSAALTDGALCAPDGGIGAYDMLDFWKNNGEKDEICPVCSRKKCPFIEKEMNKALGLLDKYRHKPNGEYFALLRSDYHFYRPLLTIKNTFNSTAPVVMSHLSMLEDKKFYSTTNNLKGLFNDRFLLDRKIGSFKSLSANTQTTLQIFAYGNESREPKYNSFYHYMGIVEGTGRSSGLTGRDHDSAIKELYNNMNPTKRNIFVLNELIKEHNNKVSPEVKKIGELTSDFLAGANSNNSDIVENQYNWAIPGTGVKSKWQRDIQQAIFGLENMEAALEIGMYTPGRTNISTNAARFSTLGDSDKYPHGVLQENGNFEGSQVNAFRHALWQATITAKFGEKTASRVADAHETYRTLDLNVRHFKTLPEADQTIDMLNNPQGRAVGMKNTGATQKNLAKEVLNHFHKNGLYVAKKDASGYAVVNEKITNEQFNYMNSEIDRTNKNGFTPEVVEKMKNEPLVVRDYPG